ncbi:MAG: hypothetical protein Q4A04_08265 [Eubacteriales bacterium]|nr:hypothetical protein [Eubacteriales bacterium]
MMLDLLISQQAWSHKPQRENEEGKKARNELKGQPVSMEVSAIAEAVASGHNISSGVTRDGKGDREHFVSQQMILIDVDDAGMTIEEGVTLAESKNLKVSFAYYTFSSRPEAPRFRMAFVFNRPITDFDEREAVADYFKKQFEGVADPHCDLKSNRISYGSTKGVGYANYEATNDVDSCKTKDYQPKEKKQTQHYSKKSSTAIITAAAVANIDFIRQHNADALKRIVGCITPYVASCQQDEYRYLRQMDLAKFLGVDEAVSFNCVIHPDNHPSARIYHEADGTWLYHCYGCGRTLNIKQLTEILGGFKSEYQAVKFLETVFNVTVAETEASKEAKFNIDSMLDMLASSDADGFKAVCPNAEGLIRQIEPVLIKFLIRAKGFIPHDIQPTANGEYVFFTTSRQLASEVGKTSSYPTVNKQLNELAYLHLIRKVPDEEVPQNLLHYALEHTAEGQHHAQFFAIPSFVFERLMQIEEKAIAWKRYGYSRMGLCYEMIYRNEGKEEARRVFPQTSMYINNSGKQITRKPSKKAEQYHGIINETLCSRLKDDGYCTEASLIKALPLSFDKAKRQVKKSLPELMGAYSLKRIRLNKELKKSLNIKIDGFPYIIVEEGVLNE